MIPTWCQQHSTLLTNCRWYCIIFCLFHCWPLVLRLLHDQKWYQCLIVSYEFGLIWTWWTSQQPELCTIWLSISALLLRNVIPLLNPSRFSQNGLATKVEKSRKQMKERKNRAKKIRGVKKVLITIFLVFNSFIMHCVLSCLFCFTDASSAFCCWYFYRPRLVMPRRSKHLFTSVLLFWTLGGLVAMS